MRIELTTSAWKAEVLPLNYTRIKAKYRWSGSNRHSVRNTILSRARLPIPPHRQNMEAATGFEPVVKVLQTLALPLGYAANSVKANEDSKVYFPTGCFI
jgi:hypothetical protein